MQVLLKRRPTFVPLWTLLVVESLDRCLCVHEHFSPVMFSAVM